MTKLDPCFCFVVRISFAVCLIILTDFPARCYVCLHCFDWLLLRVCQLPVFDLPSDWCFVCVLPRFPTSAFIVRFDWFLSSVLFSRAFRRMSAICFSVPMSSFGGIRFPSLSPSLFFFLFTKCDLQYVFYLTCLVIYF